jgi:hypothetical protein
VILFIINATVFLPSPRVVAWREASVGVLLLSCGLGGGVLALIAVVLWRERSGLVWLAMVPGLFVVFMLAEFLVPVLFW